MLEGLEISEVMLSEVLKDNDTNRIDSEYFKKDFFNFFKNISNLEPLANFVEDGYRVVYENTEIVDSDLGQRMNLPYFLQATDLETPFIRTDNLFYVNESEWNRYPKGRIKRGELLIEVKGKLEKVSIVPDDFPEKTLVSGSLFKLTVNERINKHVLLCYLICKYGVAFKDRYKTNLLISYISKSDLYRIPIPNFSLQFQNEIDRRFKSLYEKQKQSKSLYSEAEEILLSELGIKDWQPNSAPVNIKQLKESFEVSGRLDAEYYQTKYDELFSRLSKFECSTIKNIATIKKSIEPGSDAYQECGIPFVRVSDVTKFGISEPNIYLSPKDFDLKELQPKKNTILLSKDGSVGIAYKVENDMDCITSGALLHLSVFNQDYTPDYLTLVLNSIVVRMQAERDSNGAIIKHWKPSEIEQVIIPKLPMPIQETISAKIQESFALKAESKRLLEEAKLMVEREIEKGGK